MKMEFQIQSIGSVQIIDHAFLIQLDEKFVPALTNIDGFSHLQIVWWAHLTDNAQNRERFTLDKLFKKGPDQLGVFATRSPVRPNPILISTIKVREIDYNAGAIYTPFIDAADGTPVLDIKPYFAMERVKSHQVPTWCQHWPKWFEDAIGFNWHDEIESM
jgi:tRNA-Thr(GGU) m(6)t(6)A37 methyltransferase TsaA